MWAFKYYDINKGVDWVGLETDCDWFQDMKNVPQDSIWHQEGDVQIHTKLVCIKLMQLNSFKYLTNQNKHILVTAALMHDMEKRSTTVEELIEGKLRIVAPRHPEKGEKSAREILYKIFDCPNEVREHICKLIKFHQKPLHDLDERKIIKIATQVNIANLCMLARADILGRMCNDSQEQLDKIEYFSLYAYELGCYQSPRKFLNNIAEYHYLNNNDSHLDHQPWHEPKCKVLVMSALPGTGKDTYISKLTPSWNVISLDDIRKELKVKPTDSKGNGKVIQLAKLRAKEFLRKGIDFIWNGTNITKDMRAQVIGLFLEYKAEVKIVNLEVPYKTLLKQNRNREEVLPQSVIDRMISKWEPAIIGEAHFVTTVI